MTLKIFQPQNGNGFYSTHFLFELAVVLPLCKVYVYVFLRIFFKPQNTGCVKVLTNVILSGCSVDFLLHVASVAIWQDFKPADFAVSNRKRFPKVC